MSNADRDLADKLAARDRARAEFKRRLTLAKVDLAPAVVKRRAVAEVRQTAISVSKQTLEIAGEYPGIIAATVTALLLWLTRKPLAAGAIRLAGRFQRPRSPIDRLKLLMADTYRKLKEYAYE